MKYFILLLLASVLYGKESCYTVVGELVDCTRLEPEGNECDRCKAGVADNTQD